MRPMRRIVPALLLTLVLSAPVALATQQIVPAGHGCLNADMVFDGFYVRWWHPSDGCNSEAGHTCMYVHLQYITQEVTLTRNNVRPCLGMH